MYTFIGARRELARATTERTRVSKISPHFWKKVRHFTAYEEQCSKCFSSTVGFRFPVSICPSWRARSNKPWLYSQPTLCLDSFLFFSCVHGGFVIDLLCCCLPSHPHVLSLFFWYFLILYQAATFFVIVFWPSQDKLFCFACQVDRKQLAAVTCSILSLCLRLSSRASSSSAPPRRPANSHRSFRIGRRHGAVRVASSQSLIQSPLESRWDWAGRKLTAVDCGNNPRKVYVFVRCVIFVNETSPWRHFHDGYERLRRGSFFLHFGRSGRYRLGQRITGGDVYPTPSFAQRYELLHLFHVLLRTHHRSYRSTRFRQLCRVRGK